jgi:exodeoxyribonuclease VII small subunit
MPLEQLLSGYQRGASCWQFCRERWQAVENQIKVLDEGHAQDVDARVKHRRPHAGL